MTECPFCFSKNIIKHKSTYWNWAECRDCGNRWDCSRPSHNQKPKTELDKVISDLTELYNKASAYEWVNNPVAYSLYQTWRKYDNK